MKAQKFSRSRGQIVSALCFMIQGIVDGNVESLKPLDTGSKFLRLEGLMIRCKEIVCNGLGRRLEHPGHDQSMRR